MRLFTRCIAVARLLTLVTIIEPPLLHPHVQHLSEQMQQAFYAWTWYIFPPRFFEIVDTDYQNRIATTAPICTIFKSTNVASLLCMDLVDVSTPLPLDYSRLAHPIVDTGYHNWATTAPHTRTTFSNYTLDVNSGSRLITPVYNSVTSSIHGRHFPLRYL